MNKRLIKYLGMVLLLIGFSALVYAKGGGDRKAPTSTKGSPSWTHFNINNVSTWFQNTGSSDISQAGNSGLVYPKGSGRTAAFQSGFLWGGKVDGTVQVGGSTYYQGTVPGAILPDGTAEPFDPEANDNNRIFRVRRDYADPNASFAAEVDDEEGTEAEIKAQYAKDWNEWPASKGAPYEDVDGNGSYNPSIDIPGVPGADQTIWFVANDLDAAQVSGMYGALPMGIEEQATIWGYNSTGALGNMFFRKYTIINKNLNGKPFEDMFVSMWSDVDLGDAGDDFCGCDTTLSMMYFYNGTATDATYSPLPPPATGFDFFQGPCIPGEATDRAIFKGKYKYGYKNLGMTGFYFFINSDAVYTDPGRANYTTGALQFWNLFNGLVSTTGQPFTDPNTGAVTKFPLAGDPITRTGWIDGQLHAPSDRRGGMSSGPFNMAYGDTQEVVVSEMCAGATTGVDRLGAVQLLKFYDAQAQLTYDNFFNVAAPPPAPKVVASEFDQEVVLSWGSDIASVKKTEEYSSAGYAFQGYNVYQIDITGSAKPVRLATYDLNDGIGKILDKQFDTEGGVVTDKVVEFGGDSGVKRSYVFKYDEMQGGTIIRNGSRYQLAVTAYAFNSDPNAVPKTLENPITIIEVVPHTPNPGVTYGAEINSVISATHTSTNGVLSDGIVKATVIDPSKVTGQTYKVTFADDGAGGTVWSLARGSSVVLENQANLTGDDAYYLVDGLQVKVTGPTSIGLKSEAAGGLKMVAGSRRHTQLDGDGYSSYFEGWRGVMSYYSPAAFFNGLDMVVKPSEVKNLLIKLAKVDDVITPTFNPDDPNMSYGYRYVRGAQSAPAKPEFAPYLITPESYGYQDYVKGVPMSVWNYDNTANPKRLAVGFLENNAAKGSVDGKHWPAYYLDLEDASTNNTASTGPREWLYVMDDPYTDATPDPKYMVNLNNSTDARAMYIFTWTRRDADPWLGTEQYGIYANKINTVNDVFTFTAPSVTTDNSKAVTDVEAINVFPNPYYGVNPLEINKYQRFVTFSHLPQNATIRIFNLAGQQVRKLEKNTTDQFFRWDLNNESQLPVASGLYIVYIDMPDLGTTKILKVAVVLEQQILDRF